jgi:hypothetical protein
VGLLYVDDLLICSNVPSDIATMKKSFHDQFKMTDEGEVTHFLQIEVSRNRYTRTISLSQRQYIEDLLDKYAEHVPFAAGIPMKVGLKLPAEGPATGSSEHQAMKKKKESATVCSLAEIALKPSNLLFNSNLYSFIHSSYTFWSPRLSDASTYHCGLSLYQTNRKTFPNM